jgi:hypothetical protein
MCVHDVSWRNPSKGLVSLGAASANLDVSDAYAYVVTVSAA